MNKTKEHRTIVNCYVSIESDCNWREEEFHIEIAAIFGTINLDSDIDKIKDEVWEFLAAIEPKEEVLYEVRLMKEFESVDFGREVYFKVLNYFETPFI